MPLPRQTFRRSGAVLVAAFAVMGLLAGCAQSSAQDNAAGSGTAADTKAGIAEAKDAMAAFAQPLTSYPAEPALATTPDIQGKKVVIIPLGDQIPVIHGVAVGIEDALKAVGATTTICDGKFNPTSVADCLKQAGDQGADAVVSLFVDYAMAGTAFDALAAKGVHVLIGGVAPTGGRTADATLAFYDNTGRVKKLWDAMAASAVANGGADTQALFLTLMDSSTTRDASAEAVKKFGELCPTCKVATAEFTTANIDKLPSAVSAALVQHPGTNTLVVPVDSFVPPALQGVQAAGKAGKIKVISSSSDLAGLQRIKDGQQVSDLGTPVIYEGWKFANGLMQLLAGEPVQKADALVTRDFNAQNVGDLDLSDSAYFTMKWFGDESFKDAFLNAWGVK
jgi:ribose transport system substrate-binding protein